MFSVLLIASLLWALEKVGYGRLILLVFGDTESCRRLSSGIGIEALRFDEESVILELRSGTMITSSSSSYLEELFRLEREDLGFRLRRWSLP
jgi:hypothetical protein